MERKVNLLSRPASRNTIVFNQSINQYAFISNMTPARLLQYLEVIKRIHKNLH